MGDVKSLGISIQSRTQGIEMNAAPHEACTAVPVSQFGKGHWSLLAYVESLCVDGKDGKGKIDNRRMRVNKLRHPSKSHLARWKEEDNTVARDGFGETVQIEGHDDWNCLADCAAAGYVEIISFGSGTVSMTAKGMDVVAAVRKHKALWGGDFYDFVWSESLA